MITMRFVYDTATGEEEGCDLMCLGRNLNALCTYPCSARWMQVLLPMAPTSLLKGRGMKKGGDESIPKWLLSWS